MVEIVVPQNWVGKSLVDLGVRERLGINVVGIIKNGRSKSRSIRRSRFGKKKY